MEAALIEVLKTVVTKYPKAMGGFLALSAVYQVFCFVASMTKTDQDDKIADRIKRFFSLPVNPTSK